MFFYSHKRFSARVRWSLGILLALLALLTAFSGAQNDASARKVRSRVMPVYPELARKLNLVATVKVQVTVAPNGSVTQAKAIGGHPLLIAPSVEAAKGYRFEPAAETTTSIIEFHFAPGAN
jgi:TonB family protein